MGRMQPKTLFDFLVEQDLKAHHRRLFQLISMQTMHLINIAIVAHEANRAWCLTNGDSSQKHWEEAEVWQRESAIKGVEFRLANPDAKASAQHDAWSADKVADGWVYGEIKDAAAKTHPCLVPFERLPEFQQKKDRLFQAIVDALK